MIICYSIAHIALILVADMNTQILLLALIMYFMMYYDIMIVVCNVM